MNNGKKSSQAWWQSVEWHRQHREQEQVNKNRKQDDDVTA
jgi:hypothetical protein